MSTFYRFLQFLHLSPKTLKPLESPKPEVEALKGLCVTTCRVEPVVTEEKVEVCLEFPFLGETFCIRRRATLDDPEASYDIEADVALHFKEQFGIDLPSATRSLLWQRISDQLQRYTTAS